VAKEIVEVPITGKIISVDVKVGDTVKEGDVLCMLESMKMENPILAPVDGTVTEIGVTADQVVKPGEMIAVIEY
jgi:biotin carboxyl carrier protein